MDSDKSGQSEKNNFMFTARGLQQNDMILCKHGALLFPVSFSQLEKSNFRGKKKGYLPVVGSFRKKLHPRS